MSYSNWMENRIQNHIFGKSIYFASTMYVGLLRANPGEGGSYLEVNNTYDYARVAASSGAWSSSSGGQIVNTDTINFPRSTGNWGVVTHWALFNSGSHGSGNLLIYGSLAAARNITTYSEPRFNPGEISITLD